MKYIIIFLFTITIYSQSNVQIEYEFLINPELINMFPEFQNIENEIQTLELILNFDDNKSVFFNNNKTKENEMAEVFARANVTLYFDKKNEKFIYNNSDRFYFKKNQYLIEEPQNLDWDISTESKEIMNYTAFKAVLKNEKNTIAWFVPEIPFSYGPGKYNGLPGLILELQNNQGFYVTKKIFFKVNNLIKVPTEGELITKNKFLEIEKQIQEDMKNI